ncbi:MAG: precorrin-6y C5,15-methyltransferase (decarboxylating) subunit CbiE [Bacteroidaceae bacterium]|nr:precorrin-6y C5,15-methyltransferase (decarboxylating) subunit CbiE [Bacteroidaceae bacterium]
MSHLRFIVIGITDAPRPWFPPEVMEVIKEGKVFSGGKRHHEIVAPLLPEGAEWIDITVPLEGVFNAYRLRSIAAKTIGVFASGDPLFFGFANTLRREFPDAEIQVFPTFNSLQMLAHRLVMPYHDMRIVSLTGRPWPEFDRALIERTPKMGVLTDKEHTPAAIAQRMLEYGYTHYQMHVGEHLGNPEKEKVTTLTLEEAACTEFSMPNCLILEGNHSSFFTLHSSLRYGLPDSSFALLNGREKMITKMPIRLLTLQALELPTKKVLWDIGACTGSVSIEARLLFPHLHVEAFEIRPECEAIIHENCRRHGALGIEVHIGDFGLSPDPSPVREGRPDAVFIGGHGGKLKEIMAKVVKVLAPGGVIVMNSVKAPKVLRDSHQLWDEACAELGLQQETPTRILLDDHHPIEILKAVKV